MKSLRSIGNVLLRNYFITRQTSLQKVSILFFVQVFFCVCFFHAKSDYLICRFFSFHHFSYLCVSSISVFVFL